MGIREAFKSAVTLGLAKMGQLEIDKFEGMRAKNGGNPGEFERNPTVNQRSLLEKATEAREKYGTKIGRFMAEFNSKAGKHVGFAGGLVTNPNVEQKTFSQRVHAGMDAAKPPRK